MRLWHLMLLMLCAVCRAAKVAVHPHSRQCVSQLFSELLAVSHWRLELVQVACGPTMIYLLSVAVHSPTTTEQGHGTTRRT